MERENFQKIRPGLLVLVIFSLILFLGERAGVLRRVRELGERVTVPVREKIYRGWQGIFRNMGDLRNLGDLRETENLKLKISLLEEENKALRKQLEAPLPPEMKFLSARTLGLTRYLIIDKGSEDGVKANMTVVSANIFVGKILTVNPATSRIILPTDPDFKIGVKTLKTRARGLAVGDFGTRIILDKVLQSETLEKDDLIITSGDGEQKDLLIGKIGAIQKVEAEAFQKAEIIPLLDYQQLENVFIVLK